MDTIFQSTMANNDYLDTDFNMEDPVEDNIDENFKNAYFIILEKI